MKFKRISQIISLMSHLANKRKFVRPKMLLTKKFMSDTCPQGHILLRKFENYY